MILFAAYTAAETPNAFQWSEKLLKIANSRGSFGAPLMSHPNGISIGSAVFARITDVINRQTTLL